MGLVVVTFAFLGRTRAAAHELVPRAAVTASSHDDLSALLVEYAPPSVPAALANYRAAAQLWNDGSSWDAAAQFALAAKTSPDFAAAHLWCATSANYVDANLRQQYASAVLFRHALNERQRELLDALGPSMGDPEDLETTVTKLSELVQRHPDDNDLRFVLAARLERLGEIDRGLDVLAPVLASDHPLPLAHLLHARLVLADERVEEARTSLRACVDASSTAMNASTRSRPSSGTRGAARGSSQSVARCSPVAPTPASDMIAWATPCSHRIAHPRRYEPPTRGSTTRLRRARRFPAPGRRMRSTTPSPRATSPTQSASPRVGRRSPPTQSRGPRPTDTERC